MHDVPALATVLRRDRLLVLTGIALVVGLAWTYMMHVVSGTGGMAGDMAMPLTHSWGPTDLVLVSLMWTVMMIAMMVPTAAPMVLLFATVNRRRREQHQPYVPTAVFLFGYWVVWAGFAILATGGQWALHETTLLSSRMGRVAAVPGGLVLVAAGVFQWTPLKDVCLRHCRTPFAFLMTEWRDSNRGALVMGIRHGTVCLGCCWALMGLMFVGGVMNLLWMAAIAGYVLLEKVVPAGHQIGRITGAVLVGWGLWTLISLAVS